MPPLVDDALVTVARCPPRATLISDELLPDIICRLRIVRIGRFFSILTIFGGNRPQPPENP